MANRLDLSLPYIEQALAQLEVFEEDIPWMYLDTVGAVTVAIGKMLPSVDEALKLPFVDPATGKAANPPMVRACFQRVKSMPPKRIARFYRFDGAVELLPADRKSLLLQTVATMVEEFVLGHGFCQFECYPVAAQVALVDMIYNLGVPKLTVGYPRMLAAVRSRNWATAADECRRLGISDVRNQWTRANFLAAAMAA